MIVNRRLAFLQNLIDEKGFKATDWANVVSQVVGGKKGGKDDSAAGAGTEVKAVEEAVSLANQFALMKIRG